MISNAEVTPMSDHDFERIEALFQAAADLSGAERAAYLDRECGDQPDVRAAVERLLARLADGASLAGPPRAYGGPILAAAMTEGPGAVIDRYKLLQVIGEGGFGVVYMAEQQEPVVRKVALKIIKAGMDTREVIARFEAERQALALMDHPNIARVLDGGATASGRPYFVMELVRGVAVTEYCDKNELSTDERLALFRKTCNAVHHAHQKGVIHRDLKPSNVLVTLHDGEPVPMIIDFGVAKAMHGRLTDKTLFTRYEQFIGTPVYMSPEQAELSALDVDTRTDIYSLGVLLYELLTGTTPFDVTSLREAGIVEFQRIVREEPPLRPSMRISSTTDVTLARRRGLDLDGLKRQLAGDLDWIVLRALEKDRARRYPSASEFAEDIRRYLADEPVTAGPPGTRYRIRKFVARNRGLVISTALVGIVLVSGIIATTTAMLRASANADRATTQAQRALTALDFFLSTLSLTDPDMALDPEVSVRTLLDSAADRVAVVFREDPFAELRVRATIGRAYENLGEHELAEPQLRRVVELVERHSVVDDRLSLGEETGGYTALDFHETLWTLTNVCFELELEDAFEISTRSREVGIGVIRERAPRAADALEEFALAVEAGAWSLDADAFAGIDGRFERARSLAENAFEPEDPVWIAYINAFLAAGYTVWYTPHEPYAERFWGEALAIQQRVLPPDHPDIAETVSLLVGVLNGAGKTSEAESLIRDSIESLSRVHRDGAIALAIANGMLGETLRLQRRFEEAEQVLLPSHEDLVAAIGDSANWRVLESDVRVIKLYEDWERPDLGEPYRVHLAKTLASSPYAPLWVNLRYTFTGDDAPLIGVGDRVQEVFGGVSMLAEPGTVMSEDVPAAVDGLVGALETRPADDGSHAVTSLARTMLAWAHALDRSTHANERRRMFEAALPYLEAGGSDTNAAVLALDRADALAGLAHDAARAGEDERARDLALAAWQLVRDQPGARFWYIASARVRIAQGLMAGGLDESAEALLLDAIESIRAQLGAEHSEVRYARRLLAELYRRLGRLRDSARFEDPEAPADAGADR